MPEPLDAVDAKILDLIQHDAGLSVAEIAERVGLSSSPCWRRIPIIALSANAMVHQVNEYLSAGMDMHVAKPIQLAKLHNALERVLSEAEAESQAPAKDAVA